MEEGRPTATFILALISGIFVMLGALPMMVGPFFMTGMGHMGMMSTMMGNLMVAIGGIGIASGTIILLGALMLYTHPEQHAAWGALILVFSIISILGMGGFLVGAIIGSVAGGLALGAKSPIRQVKA